MAAVLHLAPAATSVAQARHWSRDVVAPAAAPEVAEVVTLLVSELVSNVVLHARTECSLHLLPAEDRIRIEVRDADDRMPAGPEVPDPFASSGRGLLLVERLSLAHGVDPEPGGGKRVWCEVALRCPSSLAQPSVLVDHP